MEHSREILAEHGYSAAEIEGLVELGRRGATNELPPSWAAKAMGGGAVRAGKVPPTLEELKGHSISRDHKKIGQSPGHGQVCRGGPIREENPFSTKCRNLYSAWS